MAEAVEEQAHQAIGGVGAVLVGRHADAADGAEQVGREEHGAAVANAPSRCGGTTMRRATGQAHYIEAPMVEHDRGDDLAVVLDWVQANLNLPFGVDHLARRANMSLRTFNRRFMATTGTAPHRWLITQRVGLAQRLLKDGSRRGAGRGADRVRDGSDAEAAFARQRGTSPQAYRRNFCKTGPVRQSQAIVTEHVPGDREPRTRIAGTR